MRIKSIGLALALSLAVLTAASAPAHAQHFHGGGLHGRGSFGGHPGFRHGFTGPHFAGGRRFWHGRWFFLGAPAGFYNPCFRPVWTPWGWGWINVCD